MDNIKYQNWNTDHINPQIPRTHHARLSPVLTYGVKHSHDAPHLTKKIAPEGRYLLNPIRKKVWGDSPHSRTG